MMDIFTTVLTRVLPVPIKPANLKVKALLKEAGTGKLKEDPDHLENHDYYFSEKNKGKESDDKENTDKSVELKKVAPTDNEIKIPAEKPQENENDGVTVSKDGVKHLDLYV
jgi:hypothetical protein